MAAYKRRRRSFVPGQSCWEDIPEGQRTRICIIYTGGTIGMKDSERGYVPVPDYINEVIVSLPMFHDLEFGDPRRGDGSIPEGTTFVTPPSKLGKRAVYNVIEYKPLMDSCNMSNVNWARMASDIERNYDTYNAFIVLHGTDTMSYTASALSFMLENLGKTVVITGSQIPVSVPLNDGLSNLLGALTIATDYETPEVLLYFNSKGMRGNRTTKGDASNFDAFVSANYAPLIEIAVDSQVHWGRMIKPPTAPFRIQTNFEKHVAVYRLFPGFTVESLRNLLQPPLRGLVLQTFGAGNAPDGNKEFLETLHEAYSRGVVIVNCTQCLKGMVAAHYATGVALREAGVTPGYDMTVEAALTKLGYLFGKGLEPEEVRKQIGVNLRGELTREDTRRFSFKDDSFVKSVWAALNKEMDGTHKVERQVGEMSFIQASLLPVLMNSAAGQGMVKELTSMLDDGADIDCTDYDRRSPLHVAAADGRLATVRLLVQRGANVNLIDRHGFTPLRDAIRGEHDDVVEFLRGHGAELRTTLAVGASLLLSAVAAGQNEAVARLLRNGLSPNLADYDGRTAAHIAACEGHLDILATLHATGACNFSAKDRWGSTPAHDALTNQHEQVSELLRSFGVADNGPAASAH